MENVAEKLWKKIKQILKIVIFRLLKLNINQTQWDTIVQFVKFMIVGCSNTIVSYIVYLPCLLLLQRGRLLPDVDYLIGHTMGFLVSVLWAFWWNRKYVFHADDNQEHWFVALLKTYASYAFTALFLSGVISAMLVNFVNVSKLLSPIISYMVSGPLNFVINKFWAFKKE